MTEATIKKPITGRRKEAIAKVWLISGTGSITVNGLPHETYFKRETDRLILKQPFQLTNTVDKFDVTASVFGGGLSGQAGALRLGISKNLAVLDENFRVLLRKNGFLTRDPRAKERKKYGRKGARKRFQWTKR